MSNIDLLSLLSQSKWKKFAINWLNISFSYKNSTKILINLLQTINRLKEKTLGGKCLNIELFFIFSRVQSKYRKKRIRKNSLFGYFLNIVKKRKVCKTKSVNHWRHATSFSLTLYVPIPQNSQTHAKNSSALWPFCGVGA